MTDTLHTVKEYRLSRYDDKSAAIIILGTNDTQAIQRAKILAAPGVRYWLVSFGGRDVSTICEPEKIELEPKSN